MTGGHRRLPFTVPPLVFSALKVPLCVFITNLSTDLNASTLKAQL